MPKKCCVCGLDCFEDFEGKRWYAKLKDNKVCHIMCMPKYKIEDFKKWEIYEWNRAIVWCLDDDE